MLKIASGLKAEYIKVKNKFDDRDREFDPVDNAEFKNFLKDLVSVYSKEDQAKIIYNYDDFGNRREKTFSARGVDTTEYTYESDTNRLISDGEYAYKYDERGNLIAKGNCYQITGDQVEFTETEITEANRHKNVQYWEYEYNLQNRLTKAYKNGELIAEFTYDANGQRIKSYQQTEDSGFQTTYYVHSYQGQVLVEDKEGDYTSYVYAHGQKYARVEGVVTVAEEIIYYHQDSLDSTKAMTNQDGKVVMRQDYMPFGNDLPSSGQEEILNETGESYKYTGQKEVKSIGLYYYNARWYDPDIGRFNRQDDWQGEKEEPQSQNPYIYVMNNPLKYNDPTGLRYGHPSREIDEEQREKISMLRARYDREVPRHRWWRIQIPRMRSEFRRFRRVLAHNR